MIPQDTDGTNGYFYELVDGNGATHNNLFTIVENGGVLTTKLFDYETDAQSMSIRARATDPYGKSVENTFSISLVNHDRFSPVSIDQGLMLWLDAGDPTTMDKGQSLGELGQPRNGEDVKFWADKSGNLHHVISETAATYMTDAIDRHYPAVETSGMFFEISICGGI